MSENKYLDYMEMPRTEQKPRNVLDDMTEGHFTPVGKMLAQHAWEPGGRQEERRKKGGVWEGRGICQRSGYRKAWNLWDWNKNINVVSGDLV